MAQACILRITQPAKRLRISGVGSKQKMMCRITVSGRVSMGASKHQSHRLGSWEMEAAAEARD